MTKKTISNLIVHDLLVARDWVDRKEFFDLGRWWQNGGRGVVALVGIGGAGKTAIADRFVRAIPRDTSSEVEIEFPAPLPPLNSIFVFSFYEQPSAEVFFAVFTAWISGSIYSETARRPTYAETLVALQRIDRHILLVLDGLEMVQDPGQRGGRLGQIMELNLRNFVTSVAKGTFADVSLVVTSRFRLYDARAKRCQYYLELSVDSLETDVACSLLKARGVTGTDTALAELCELQGGHALTIDLLGGYIARYCDGDPSRLPDDALDDSEDLQSMEASVDAEAGALLDQQRRFARLAYRYRQSLSEHDPAALALLERICLFRLGIDAQTLHSIFAGSEKTGISGEHLAGLNEQQLDLRLKILTEMRLIERSRTGNYAVHPAVRDGFVKGLDPTGVKAIQEAAVAGLEAKLVSRPGDGFPSDRPTLDLLEEITHHAIAAGHLDDAWSIYEQRLGGYSNLAWKLGLYERGERICRSFAQDPVDLVPDLQADCQSRFLNEWGLFLVDLGQMARAGSCLRLAAEKASQVVDRAVCLLNVAEVEALIGNLSHAVSCCQDARASAMGTYLNPVCDATLQHFQMLIGDQKPDAHSIRAAMYWQYYDGKVVRANHVLRGVLSMPPLWRIELSPHARNLMFAFSNTCERLRDIAIGSLLRAELAIRDRDIELAKAHVFRAEELAVEVDAHEVTCWCGCVRAHIAISDSTATSDELDSVRDYVDEALSLAEEYGYGLYHIDLLLERARLHLLRGDAGAALDDIEVALETGVPANEESGHPELLAARAPECGYAWAIPTALQLRAEALLLQAAREVISVGWASPTKDGTLNPINVEAVGSAHPTIGKLVDQAKQLLREALDLWQPLHNPDPEGPDQNFKLDDEECNYIAGETHQVLVQLEGGVLTHYPLNSSPVMDASGAKVMSKKAIDTWQEKINYLEEQLAQTADAEQEFSINKKIEEAKNKLVELSGQPPVAARAADSTPASAEQDDRNTIDVAIVIPLQEEFDELHRKIADSCRPATVEGTGAYDYLFSRPGATGDYRCVATFVGDMGETKAGLRTQQIRTKWNPKTVVVLGIAAGISKDVMVGDVVVGTLIDSYLQNVKAVDKGATSYSFEFSGEAYRPSGDLVNESRHLPYAHRAAFQAWCDSAQQRLQGALSETQINELTEKGLLRAQPVAETGHIASGPVVAAAKAFITQVKKKDRKYLALEMESGGVLAAVYEVGDPSHSLVIRGISDLGDGRKDELDAVGSGGLRRYAVQNAIQFLWGLMECDALPKAESTNP